MRENISFSTDIMKIFKEISYKWKMDDNGKVTYLEEYKKVILV